MRSLTGVDCCHSGISFFFVLRSLTRLGKDDALWWQHFKAPNCEVLVAQGIHPGTRSASRPRAGTRTWALCAPSLRGWRGSRAWPVPPKGTARAGPEQPQPWLSPAAPWPPCQASLDLEELPLFWWATLKLPCADVLQFDSVVDSAHCLKFK